MPEINPEPEPETPAEPVVLEIFSDYI